MLTGKYFVEKSLLDLFHGDLREVGPWQSLSEIKGTLLLTEATSPQELDQLVEELIKDGIFEFSEEKTSREVLRLSSVGRSRRFELGYYLTEITFGRKDDRHIDKEGRQAGCIWVRIFLNGVCWGGGFPEKHISNVRKHMPFTHTLTTCIRTNRQITEAILAEFSPAN